MKSPSDLIILEEIYNRYYSTFISFSEEKPNRSAKVYVPIDIDGIANKFKVDGDIIFGRLYYHLNPKYGFIHPDGTKVPFFSSIVGSDKNAIQFSLLSAVIANLRTERKKYLLATSLSIAAIIISIVSLTVSSLKN